MMKFLVIAALVSVAVAGGPGEPNKKCPFMVGKQPFDESKFNGEWKIVAANGMFNGPHKCAKFDFKMTKDLHSVKYSGTKDDGSVASGEIYGQSFGKMIPSSTYMAVLKKGSDQKVTPPFKLSVVATDYEDYAITLACGQHFDENLKTFSRHFKAAVMTRSGKIDNEKLELLKTVLSGYDFNPADLKMVDQTGC